MILWFWVCVARHAQSTLNKKFTYLCNSLKNVGNEVIFLTTNTKIFYKLIASLWLYVTCHFQSIINNKFAIFLHYLKENEKDEIDFLRIDKFFKFLVTFCVYPGMPKLPKIQVCYFFEISQEKIRLKLIFCMQIGLKVSVKLIQWFLLRWTRITKISKI